MDSLLFALFCPPVIAMRGSLSVRPPAIVCCHLMLLCGGCCGALLAAFDMTRVSSSSSRIVFQEGPGSYKMDAKLMPISSITDTTRQWSSKVRVVSKLAVRTALASPTKYQKMVFADTNGDTVEAIIFKNDVDLYKDNLEENKTYQISNAQVKKVKDLYKNDLVSSQFQWIITSQTAIMPIIDDIIPSSAFRPEFIDHSKFALFLESKKLINTTCVVIEKRPPRKILIRGQQHVLYEYAAIEKPIDICEIADTSVRRRLVNQGKSKIGEENVEHKYAFDDNIVQPAGLRGTESEDDELLLAELVQTRKQRRFPKKMASIVQHSSHLEPPTDYENKLTEALMETVIPVPVKLEKVGSPNRNRSKRSLKHVVIDDTSSEEDPNSGKKLNQAVNPVKDTAEKKSSPKRCKRGRVIRPKQFN